MATTLPQVSIPSIPAAMKALDKLEADIKTAPTVEILNVLADVAAGLQRRWKPVKDVADRAGECWIAAETKKGEERKKLGKAKGSRFAESTGRYATVRPVEDAPSREELGLGKREAARADKLAELGASERKRIVDDLKAEGKPVNPNTVLAKKRAENKTEKKQAIAAAVFSSCGPFDCAIIDPPWPMQKIDREVRPNQDAFDYPPMNEVELTEFWPREIADKIAADCHVFCWTTQKYLPLSLRLIEAWGMKYVLTMVWHKVGGFQPAGLPQYNCEFIIYARKGSPMFLETTAFNCCFSAPRREHSRKPDYFYDLVRRVTGGSRIDIFSREAREGFAQFGNEINKFEAA